MSLSEGTNGVALSAEPVALGIDPETLAALESIQARFGNVVAMRKTDGRAALFVNNPADIRNILVRNHTRYRKGPGFERVKMLLGNGLIVSDGDTWRRSRRMIQPAFSRQNIHQLIERMTECAEQRALQWQQVAEKGGTLNITQEMSDFSLQLILRCIFGDDYEERLIVDGANPFEFLSKESARDLRVVMQVRETRELIRALIGERRAAIKRSRFDFLNMYMDALDKHGVAFTDDELLDEIITLIVAGYETSAGTLNWAWYLIATHAEAESALLAEAQAQLPMRNVAQQQALTDMIYTQQLLEETLRLYPPVWLFTRRATEDDRIGTQAIDAGTDIYLSPYILHRTEEFWPAPLEFDPARFAIHDSEQKKAQRPYFPFSLGPRRCLGEYFSFLEMKVHLGLLIQKFRMTLTTDRAPELDLGINLRALNSIELRPTLR